MNPDSPRAEKSLAGRQTQAQATQRDSNTRSIVRTMLALFIGSVLLSLAVLAYLLVLNGKTQGEANQTRASICTVLAQLQTGESSRTITEQQRERLNADYKAFSCLIPPGTVRKP